MLGLFVDAAIIGLVIAVMEEDEFPGWGPMIGSAIFISLAGFAAEAALGGGIAGIIAGCVASGAAGGLIISWACGMSFRRAAVATAIFLTIKFVLGLAFYFMSRSAGVSSPDDEEASLRPRVSQAICLAHVKEHRVQEPISRHARASGSHASFDSPSVATTAEPDASACRRIAPSRG